jgi:AbrB family looped-hinge helix DNA binding protein
MRAKVDFYGGKTYLTEMKAQTTVSSKGQVVIPKDVRDRLRLVPGTALEIIESAGGMFLKIASSSKKRSFEECDAAIRKAIQYDGPRYTDEQEKQAIADMFKKTAKFDR